MKKLVCVLTMLLALVGGMCVYAQDYDSYIVKYKNDDELYVVTEEEKELIENRADGISLFGLQPEVEYVQPNYIYVLSDTQTEEKVDPQWSYNAINASYTEECGCFGNEIRVAVIDSGIKPTRLLNDSILQGYNYIDDSPDVTDYEEYTDSNPMAGHGTWVSSVICCAKQYNRYAQTGAAYKAKIVPLKCFQGGKGYTDKIVIAIRDAVDKYDCDVINMSFGGPKENSALKEAIDYALSKNVIVVAAAGNEADTTDGKMYDVLEYPAAYDGVIGVGSINKNNEWSSFSQRNESVDICAPGEKLALAGGDTDKGAIIATASGTSFAAPQVSAAAAIARTIDADITQEEFMNVLIATSYDLGDAGRDNLYGYGRLDIGAMCKNLIGKERFFMSPVNIENDKSVVRMFNNSGKETKAVLINASYQDGRVNNAYANDVVLSTEGVTPKEIMELEAKNKIFLWDNIDDINPLWKYREYVK